MRINHNISSMIAQGANYRINQSMSQSLARLSTGLRINRASDDAAGLSVSEEMRTQVIGGQMAERNISDAISFLRIADGAMEEVGSNLKRMRDLAVQGANDTLTRTERAYMQKEYEALRSEIERITKVTQYNGITLFEKNTGFGAAPEWAVGRYGNAVTHLESVAIVGINPLAGIQTISHEERETALPVPLALTNDTTGGRVFTFKVGPNSSGTAGSSGTRDLYNSNDMLNIALPDMSLTAIFLGSGYSAAFTRQDAVTFDHKLNDGPLTPSSMRHTYDGLTTVIGGPPFLPPGTVVKTASQSCITTISIIDGSGDGTEGTGHNQVTGLRRVNAVRSHIGSVINRLEHSLANLKNQNHNTQSAESAIRDSDFATESANFTRNQILANSSTSMLAQANATPQMILSLLQ